MPFKIADAHRHKKGMSDKEARQWVAVANSVRESCIEKGGDPKECDGKAIKQANGVIKDREKTLEEKTGMSLYEAAEWIREQFYDGQFGVVERVDTGPYVVDIYADSIIIEKNGSNYMVPFVVTGDSVQFGAEPWQEVRREWVEVKAVLKSYVNDAGIPRWISVSNVAVEDKEKEIVSEKAYDDAIAYAQKNGYGELDLVHVDGTDVGGCDMMARVDNMLIEGGPWYDTEMANKAREAVEDRPDYWGVSIKFRYDPELKVDGVYTGGIEIVKRTILPRQMAASFGTSFVSVPGGPTMSKSFDKATREALSELGVSEAKQTELEEAQKSVAEEPNVVCKEAEEEVVEETVTEDVSVQPEEAKGILAAIGKLFNISKSAVSEAQEQPKAETEVEPEVKEKSEDEEPEEVEERAEEAAQPDLAAGLTEMTKQIAMLVAEPLAQASKRIDELEALILDLQLQVNAQDKAIEDKVARHMAELPPVVKVRPTELRVNVPEVDKAKQQAPMTATQKLAQDIVNVIENAASGQKVEV